MNGRDRSDSNEGGAVMCVGGGACMGSGGVSEDYCRVTGLIRELWEDLPYSFPFFFEFNKVVPLVGLERKR